MKKTCQPDGRLASGEWSKQHISYSICIYKFLQMGDCQANCLTAWHSVGIACCDVLPVFLRYCASWIFWPRLHPQFLPIRYLKNWSIVWSGIRLGGFTKVCLLWKALVNPKKRRSSKIQDGKTSIIIHHQARWPRPHLYCYTKSRLVTSKSRSPAMKLMNNYLATWYGINAFYRNFTSWTTT